MTSRSARRTAAVAIVFPLLAAGCSSSPADEPTDPPTIDSFEPTDADTPSSSPTPSDTGSEDPFAVPDDPADIDVAYVQRVLEDAIYPVEDQVVRLQVEAAKGGGTQAPQRVFALLDAIYAGDQRVFAYDDAKDDWKDGELVAAYSDDPGPAIVEVLRVVDADADCIIAEWTRDGSPRLRESVDPSHLIGLLKPKAPDVDPDGLNLSGWVIQTQGLVSSLEGSPSC